MGSTRDVFDFPVSNSAQAAPWPGLLPLGHFADEPGDRQQQLDGLQGDARTLYLRMLRLRAKARALNSPVLSSDERRRLTNAVAASRIQ